MESGTFDVPRGTAYFAGQQVFSYVANFVFYLAIARILNLYEIGQVSILSAFLALFTTASQIALPVAATRFMSASIGRGDYSTAGAVARTSMRLILIMAGLSLALVTMLLTLSKALVPDITNYNLLLEVSFAGFVIDLTTLYGAYFLSIGHYHRVAYQNVGYVFLSRGFSLILLVLGFGIQSIILGWAVGSVVTLVYLVYFWRGKLPVGGLFPSGVLFSFSIPLFASAMISVAQTWGDVAMLQFLISRLATTGGYYLVVTASNFLAFLWVPAATALYPALSAAYSNAGKEAVSEKLAGASRLINLTVLPIAASIAAVSPTALEIAFGKALVPQATTFSILVLTALFTAQGLLLVTTLQALAKTKLLLAITFVATTLDLGFVLVAAASLGTIAGALGRLLLAVSTFSLAYTAVRRGVPLKTSNGFLQALVLALGTSIPLLGADQILMHIYNLTAIQRLPAIIIIFVSSLILMNRKFSIFSRDDFAIADHVLPRRLRVLTRLVEYLTISGQKPLVRNKLT